MRELKAKDIFTFAKLIKKMGIKNDFKNLLESMKNNTGNGNVGLELILLIIENINEAEKEFYDFIGPIIDKTEDEVKELSVNELMDALKLLMKDGAFSSFLA